MKNKLIYFYEDKESPIITDGYAYRHVTRVADVKEDALESLYEERLRKKQPNKEIEENAIEVDPVDALPEIKKVESESNEGDATGQNLSVVALTKAEKWATFKKLRKDAKKQVKEEVQRTSHAEVLKYQPYASDPNLSGALASVLWELNLLTKYYHPAVSTMASGISTMGTTNYKVYHSIVSPQQAIKELSVEQDSIVPSGDSKISKSKRKLGIDTLSSVKVRPDINLKDQSDENVVRKKLTEHFLLLRDITEEIKG
ncbi:unnamed protein product [Fraxinus pennsylvanica]|uniref:CCAAT-binding factor domain-containing protein n=1 Tax=Fraxinus pennsylvanica TaxID=56036 RepID=A0AAD1ZN30_9LAMI|nr:unnamed protein product [Fraxinus pennsylvanica]